MDKTIAALWLVIMALTTYTVGGGMMSESEFQAAIADTFICDITNVDATCKQTSNNLYSCYPYAENRTEAIRCGTSDNNGKWIGFSEYAEALGVNPFTLYIERMTQATGETVTSQQVSQAQTISKCVPSGCEVI